MSKKTKSLTELLNIELNEVENKIILTENKLERYQKKIKKLCRERISLMGQIELSEEDEF